MKINIDLNKKREKIHCRDNYLEQFGRGGKCRSCVGVRGKGDGDETVNGCASYRCFSLGSSVKEKYLYIVMIIVAIHSEKRQILSANHHKRIDLDRME